MSAWTCRSFDGKAAVKIVPPRPRIPWWKGLGADSEEKREPVSDIDTAAADSLKVLDPKWPIREADIARGPSRAKKRHRSLRVSTYSMAIRVPLAPFNSRFRWKLASGSSAYLPTCAARAAIAPGSPVSSLAYASI